MGNCQITEQYIATGSTVGIPRERVQSILTEDLAMKKLSPLSFKTSNK